MKLTKFLLALFWILAGDISAQYYYRLDHLKIDSLEALLPGSKDTSRIDILNDLAELYTKYDPDQFKKYTHLVDSLSTKLNYKRGEGMAFYNYGQEAYLEGDYIKTIDFYHRAINLFEEIGDMQNLAKTNQQMAITLFFSSTDRLGAYNYLLNAIELYHTCGDPAGEAIACFNAAAGLSRLGRDEGGLEYIQRYLKIADSIGDLPIIRGTAYAVMGDLYAGLGDNKNAKNYYRLSVATYDDKNIEDRSVKVLIIGKLGGCYEKENLLDSALFYYHEALKLDRPIHNAYNRMHDHLNVGMVYFKKLNFDLAINHLDSSLYFAQLLDSTGYYYQVDSLKNYIGHSEEIFFMVSKARRRLYAWWVKFDDYQILYNIYWQTGQYKKAAELHTPWMAIQDSINNYQRAKEQKDLQMRYETEKKEQQLQQLSKENRFKELQLNQSRWIAVGLGGVAVLILLLAIILIRQNKLRNSQETLHLQQRLLRTQMNPHFLFNSLASIQNFIIKEKPALASDYLSRFSKLVRQILNNSVEEWVPLEDEIESIENYLELQKVRHRELFEYTIEVNEAIDPEATQVPPMLTQPFIENSIEHGFKDKEGKGHMKITFKLNGKLIRFELEDDGIGREKAMQTLKSQNKDHRSMSTEITRERLKVLNKKTRQKINLSIVDLKNELGEAAGTKVVFDIPYKN